MTLSYYDMTHPLAFYSYEYIFAQALIQYPNTLFFVVINMLWYQKYSPHASHIPPSPPYKSFILLWVGRMSGTLNATKILLPLGYGGILSKRLVIRLL